jgi:hypothetical protein
MSSIMPIGIAISSATKATTNSNVGVGRTAAEMELVDSVYGDWLQGPFLISHDFREENWLLIDSGI